MEKFALYIPRNFTRKLFLPPGLIALVLLPTAFLFYVQQYRFFEKLRVMEVVWPLKSSKGYDVPVYAFDQLPKRQYHRILLTGKEHEDKACLEYAQLAMRRMMANRDTVAGIQIHFGHQAKYESFVRVLDLCQIEEVRTYMPYQDDIWICNTIPPGPTEPALPLICGIYRSTENCLSIPRPGRVHIWRAWLKVGREFWLSGVLFACLVGLASYRLQTVLANRGKPKPLID